MAFPDFSVLIFSISAPMTLFILLQFSFLPSVTSWLNDTLSVGIPSSAQWPLAPYTDAGRRLMHMWVRNGTAERLANQESSMLWNSKNSVIANFCWDIHFSWWEYTYSKGTLFAHYSFPTSVIVFSLLRLGVNGDSKMQLLIWFWDLSLLKGSKTFSLIFWS